MMIQSDTQNRQVLIALAFVAVCFPVLLFISGATLRGSILASVLPWFLSLRYWVATGRRITMDKNGYTVSFLWWNKTYRWEEIAVKRIVNLENCYEYRSPSYRAGAYFSQKPLRGPKRIKLATYCMLFHPFSFVFVYFKPQKEMAVKGYPMLYVVDETQFRERMREWHVLPLS